MNSSVCLAILTATGAASSVRWHNREGSMSNAMNSASTNTGPRLPHAAAPLTGGPRRFVPQRPLLRRPTATVVVPHYNYGQFLPSAVGSCLEQPGVEVDVIIVDDRSTDGS